LFGVEGSFFKIISRKAQQYTIVCGDSAIGQNNVVPGMDILSNILAPSRVGRAIIAQLHGFWLKNKVKKHQFIVLY